MAASPEDAIVVDGSGVIPGAQIGQLDDVLRNGFANQRRAVDRVR